MLTDASPQNTLDYYCTCQNATEPGLQYYVNTIDTVSQLRTLDSSPASDMICYSSSARRPSLSATSPTSATPRPRETAPPPSRILAEPSTPPNTLPPAPPRLALLPPPQLAVPPPPLPPRPLHRHLPQLPVPLPPTCTALARVPPPPPLAWLSTCFEAVTAMRRLVLVNLA